MYLVFRNDTLFLIVLQDGKGEEAAQVWQTLQFGDRPGEKNCPERSPASLLIYRRPGLPVCIELGIIERTGIPGRLSVKAGGSSSKDCRISVPAGTDSDAETGIFR